jgi:oligoendopeptidase F
MPERCKQCERYEKGLKELRERRTNLWRRGELTAAAAEKLAAEEQQIVEELKKHQAMQHGHSPILTAKTLAIEPSQNLEEEIRRRAYELYEERGREDGHDLDDWLRAEAEITTKNAKTAAA